MNNYRQQHTCDSSSGGGAPSRHILQLSGVQYVYQLSRRRGRGRCQPPSRAFP